MSELIFDEENFHLSPDHFGKGIKFEIVPMDDEITIGDIEWHEMGDGKVCACKGLRCGLCLGAFDHWFVQEMYDFLGSRGGPFAIISLTAGVIWNVDRWLLAKHDLAFLRNFFMIEKWVGQPFMDGPCFGVFDAVAKELETDDHTIMWGVSSFLVTRPITDHEVSGLKKWSLEFGALDVSNYASLEQLCECSGYGDAFLPKDFAIQTVERTAACEAQEKLAKRVQDKMSWWSNQSHRLILNKMCYREGKFELNI